MSSDQIIFAGVDISSGRKPVTFAALDGDLNILILEKWDTSETLEHLNEYQPAVLAINSSGQKRESYSDFKNKITQSEFKPFSRTDATDQWIETVAQDCFRALIGQELLSRRTLEGRIQRALILYDEGLQIPDPMDFFEEITRHKLMQGILPLENVYSFRQLDALVAAYTAWMTINRSGQMEIQGGNIARLREQTGD
ncbi:MAG: hypothetical protein ABI621_08245 [Chloroflexota bacterium]